MPLQKPRPKTAGAKREHASLGAKGEEAATRKRGKDWVSIDDGETVVLRIFPETFEEVYVHRTPIDVEQGEGRKKKVVTKHYDVPCLDQDEEGIKCPGCTDDLERRYKFYVWVIQRGNPDADEAADKKDKLALWSGGVKLFKALNKKHKTRGLENRDIEVTRSGIKLDTEYEVEWFDEENTPLSAADKKLADKIESLDFYTKPPEFDDFYVAPGERAKDDDEDEDVGARSQRRGSPFSGERKKAGTTSRKSGSSGSGKTGLAKLRQQKAESGSSRSSRSKPAPAKKIIRRK